jgi:protein TorT
VRVVDTKILALGLVSTFLVACGSGAEETATDAPVEGLPDPWSFDAFFTDCDGEKTDPAGCVGPRESSTYESIASSEVSKPWELCAVVPHMKDPYWVGVNYGMVSEARRLGVNLQMFDAGGYEGLATQLNQIDDCAASGADAVIIGGVSYDGLNPKVSELVDEGIVVIDSMNGVSSPLPHARAVVEYFDIGRAAAENLIGLDEELTVAWFPGPPGAGWSEATDTGFKEGLEGHPEIEVVATKFGDTGRDVQLSLLEDTLRSTGEVDIIAGTAVTADVASTLLAQLGHDNTRVMANYLSPETFSHIEDGGVTCGLSDQPVIQAQMSVDMAVRLLEGIELSQGFERAAPAIAKACGPSSEEPNTDEFLKSGSFAPDGWDPVTSVRADS